MLESLVLVNEIAKEIMQDFDTEIFIEDIKKFWLPKGASVIHCGAHLAEEAKDYDQNNFSPVIWIEAAPNLIEPLEERVKSYPESKVIKAALWPSSGEIKKLLITNNSYSSSFKDFGTHKATYPEVEFVKEVELVTTSLDDLKIPVLTQCLLVLDLQGIEFEVIQGAKRILDDCAAVYVEVSKIELYSGEHRWEEVTELLKDMKLNLVDWQYSDDLNWGNALYLRDIPRFLIARRTVRRWRHNLRRRQTIN